jgi:signal transduction histidine kinase
MSFESPPDLLLVDDDPTARQVAQAILAQDTYAFRHASGGEAALALIVEKEPDLVLLDVMMPGIDGFEVCRRIRKMPTRAYLPIMMITALDSPKDLARGLDAGADDFISKPVPRVELRARVRSMLRIRHQHLELVQQARMLRELNNQREDLVRMVVHDLRSPVTAIQLAASALIANDKATRAEQEADLRLIKEEARRVGNYLEEMLLLARQEEGRLSLSFERVDLGAVARETIHALRPVAKARGITIKSAAEGDTGVVLGDAALLRRVVDNLLTNAIKFSPRNTMVEVHVGVDGSDVTLDVVDEGLGVPEEMRGRIFEKYEIVKVRAAGGPQTGLGLPFCRTVVEAHGGYISCLPREGRGSRFHVKFPAAKATPDV